jgi:hypothetical protein
MKRNYGTALLAALLLAACGGDNEADAEAEARARWALNTPVCEHLGLTELQSFTGREYQAGEVLAETPAAHRCVWRPVEGETGVITYTVHPGAPDQVEEQYTSMPGMQPIEGPGDEAYWSDAVQTYVVRQLNRLIVVGFDYPDGSHRAQAEQLVRRAIERF